VEKNLYVLSAESMKRNDQRCALSGLPIVRKTTKPEMVS
jgi:hypothetical protein